MPEMITRWDRVEPAEPCASPDGHQLVDDLDYSSPVPRGTVCTRCHRSGGIVTRAEPPDDVSGRVE